MLIAGWNFKGANNSRTPALPHSSTPALPHFNT